MKNTTLGYEMSPGKITDIIVSCASINGDGMGGERANYLNLNDTFY